MGSDATMDCTEVLFITGAGQEAATYPACSGGASAFQQDDAGRGP
jgi:hypothetical protein